MKRDESSVSDSGVSEELMRALSGVVKPEAIGVWMREPNEAFDGLTPAELLERGEVDRLWGMVFDLRVGGAG